MSASGAGGGPFRTSGQARPGGSGRPLDLETVTRRLESVRADGITGAAVVLMHGYRSPDHEQRVAEQARTLGFTQVGCSHEVSPLVKLVPRGDTTVVDAYLSPILKRYVDQVASELAGIRLMFMPSNGGLREATHFRGKDAVLSGPAGGSSERPVPPGRPASRRSSASTWVARPPMSPTTRASSSANSARRSPVCGCARR